MPNKCITLLSGGLDSVTLAYLLRAEGYDQHFLSFNYGQRHRKELEYAAITAEMLDCPHDVVDLTSITRLLVGSSLTDLAVAVPEGHYAEETMRATVVPNRNAIMLSIAYGVASSIGAKKVATAVHAGDHAQYPDCRPDFTLRFENMEEWALNGFNCPALYTPFLYKSKQQIAATAGELSVPIDKTWSCYKGGTNHCGKCGTCCERAEALALADVTDTTTYDDPEFWKTAVKEYNERT